VTREELAAFDDSLLQSVGREVGVDRLAALARDHQAGVRELPGVDSIVYEWRHQLPVDPLLLRSPDVYVFALPDRVWTEFLDELEANRSEAEALRDLHDRQARRLLDSAEGPEAGDALTTHAAMVLVRP